MLWVIRALWLTLPISVGTALGDRVAHFSTPTAIAFAILAYAAWAVGLIALLVPRDVSFTALRVVALLPLFGTIWALGSTAAAIGAISIIHALIAGTLAVSVFVAEPCMNAQSYGDEIRVSLRTPPPMLAVAAVAVAIVDVGIAVGPLLLAGKHVVAGVILTLVGTAMAAVMLRSLHTLSKRFCVFVPAGIAIADSLKLVDPVLLPRERIVGLSATSQPSVALDAIDTRLGAAVGSLSLMLNEPGQFVLRTAGKKMNTVSSSQVLFTPLRSKAFLAIARDHKIIS